MSNVGNMHGGHATGAFGGMSGTYPSAEFPHPDTNLLTFNAYSVPPRHATDIPLSNLSPYQFGHPTARFATDYGRLVELPKFSGDPLEWPMFERSYIDTTVEFQYNNMRNLTRLRQALVGEARATVEAMLPFPESVSEIMTILKETYGRPEQLMNRQMADIRKYNKIQFGNSTALTKFSNLLKNMVAYAKYARADYRLCDAALLTECVGKLPYELQIQWAEYREGIEGYPSLVALSQFLSIAAKRANAVQDSLPRNTDTQRGYTQANVKSHARGHAFLAAKEEACIICKKSCNAVSNCDQFKSSAVEDRWAKVKEFRLCFMCLKPGHPASKCYSKKKCAENGCGHRHHRMLHKDQSIAKPVKEVAFSGEAYANNAGVLFQILPVTISVGSRSVNTYAFIDQGASHSMMEMRLAQRLGLSGVKDVLEMHWINNVQVKHPTERVSFSICGTDRKCKPVIMRNVYTVSDLNLPTQTVDFDMNVGRGKWRSHLSLKYTDAVPELVIGLDYASVTRAMEKPQVVNNAGTVAAYTKLGWVLFGPNEGTNERVFAGCCVRSELHQLEELMREHFKNDDIGAIKREQQFLSDDDRRAVEIMKNSTVYKENRYEVRLLWKSDDVTLPNSYKMAERRLKGVENKMMKDANFAEQYKNAMLDYVNKGYARKLTKEEMMQESEKTFYLPHFAVRNPNKKKIRVVFDAAAEINGSSLNKELLAGPDLNASLLSVLFKFRLGSIGVCADIREMFLQVVVNKEDQDSQRYLWRDGDPNREIDVFVMTRMLFGAKCSPTLAQFVKNSNAEKYADRFPRAAEAIINHHYVDDFVDAFDDELEAEQVVKQVVDINRMGGFELCNFSSNSSRVLSAVDDKTSATNVINMQGRNVERVLGMHWDCEKDAFVFVLKFNKVRAEIIHQQCRPTKREVLSVVMSIFDPFGLLASFVIGGKLLMQRLWASKVDWDEQLSDTHYVQWQKWMKNLPEVERTVEPRCYAVQLSDAEKIELHIFADASESAVAAVAYLRVINHRGRTVRFVCAKTRCAPIKYTSIPRLELQAAVLAVRIKDLIVENHQWQGVATYFWTDSTTVLNWLNSNTRRYKPYVANRLGEILEASDAAQWSWVPSAQNVADDATRVNLKYVANSRWVTGPEFLCCDENEWPKQPQQFIVDSEAVAEIRNAEHVFIAAELKTGCTVIKFERFSNFNRMRRTLAWVLKFGRRWRGKAVQYSNKLQIEEIEYAEKLLCRLVQKECFAAEIGSLERGEAVNKNSSIADLNPKFDEMGIMRVSGRIERAEWLELSTRRQIILPKGHRVTYLVADYYHRKFRHLNRNTIICEIRRKFWVPSIRVLMKTVESRCNFCKIRRTLPVVPIMGLLPPDRITPFVNPFSYTGVDFFGPLTVTIRRQHEKRWVALFTCLSTRAIHLELVADLSSDACLLAVRNFVNRRGVPKMMRSDNGTNFVGLQKELKGVRDFLDYDAIGEGLTNLGIQWRFNCPANPSEGGAWERLVQSVKKVLMIVLKEKAPRLETLISVLTEAENIVNSRPLTHLPVSSDEEDPLTPNHFLLNGPNSTQTPSAYVENMCLRKQWRIAQNIKNGFWNRWVREYMPELTRRTKWCAPTSPLKTGDLVLICDPAAARSQWKRGRIMHLIKGADGVARSAEVRTAQNVLRRPVSKLAKLEVAADVE